MKYILNFIWLSALALTHVACLGTGYYDETCTIGAAGCPCSTRGKCEQGLSCVSQLCVEVEGDEESPVDSVPDPDGDTKADTDTDAASDENRHQCGDGFVWDMECGEHCEQCDDGNDDNTDSCIEGCRPATCGDGYIWTGVESCDDNGTKAGDFCSSDCRQAGWHSFWANKGNSEGKSISIDTQGNVYIAGQAKATWTGPNGEMPLNPHSGGDAYDICVLKLSSRGEYEWHSFFGADDNDFANGIWLDRNNDVYVVGDSPNAWEGPEGQEPLNAHSGHSGYYDREGYILKLSSSGDYKWHTFFGSSDGDIAKAIAGDADGNLLVTGSSDRPWVGPEEQDPLNPHFGENQIYVLKLSSTGHYQWHTFLDTDGVYDLTVHKNGNIYLAGASRSWNGPKGQSPLNAHTDYYDLFVVKMRPSGEYEWHTFYGAIDADYAFGIAVDAEENVYTTGYSSGTWDGPLGQSPLNEHSGEKDVFVLKLGSFGTYDWHSFYGSADCDEALDLTLEQNGNIYLTGHADEAWDGPKGQSPLNDYSAASDIFVLKLISSGTYQWHTFLGSSGMDKAYGIFSDQNGFVYATGFSDKTWSGPGGELPLNPHSNGYRNNILVFNIVTDAMN